MPRLRFPCRAALAALLAYPALALAQPALTLSPKDGTLPNLTPVAVSAARCVALSEAHRLLAFGHDQAHTAAHVSLVRLDEKGTPAAYATSWKLPRPDALDKTKPVTATYPLGLAFHPKLPLLYVWQEAAVHFPNPPPPTVPPQLKDFDHLLIYDVSKPQPELLVSLCRGAGYVYGMQGGGLAVDREGSFLYVPNFFDPKNRGYFKFGRFPLDADGLPDVLGEKGGKLPRAERLKKLAVRGAAGMIPPEMTAFEYGYVLSYNHNSGYGSSFVPVSKDAVLAGGPRGVLVWRPNDKDCALSALPLKKAANLQISRHPTLPLLFATGYGSDSLYRVQHVEGYPTLLPEQWTIPDAALTSAPAVLDKGGKVAVGGRYALYVIGLDEQGRARPDVVQVRVFNPQVRALVYSERFDRLYVSVEVSR